MTRELETKINKKAKSLATEIFYAADSDKEGVDESLEILMTFFELLESTGKLVVINFTAVSSMSIRIEYRIYGSIKITKYLIDFNKIKKLKSCKDMPQSLVNVLGY